MKAFFRNFMLNFTKVTGFPFFMLWLAPRIYRENPKKSRKKEAEIVVANHTTLIDFAMLLILYGFRVVRVLMAEVLFEKPLSAMFMRWMHGIRVDRNSSTDTAYMQEARETLAAGGVVGIFPEGRLNKQGMNFGPMLPFSRGSVYLSITTGAKIRPVYLYTERRFFKSSAMLVGEPIDMRARFGSEPTAEALDAANRLLREKLESMRDDLKLRVRHRPDSPLTRHMRWGIGMGMTLGFRPVYHYTDSAVQERVLKKPTIIVSNHSSYYDPPMLCTVFRKSALHMLAGEILYEKRMLAWLLNRMGCIRIDRTALDMDSMHAISMVLSRKESVGIFPEGALYTDGELHPFKAGFILSAMTSGAEILPVYIGSEYRMFRKRQHIWIDVPMKTEAPMTPDGIRAETDRVYNRMKQLREQSIQYMEAERNHG